LHKKINNTAALLQSFLQKNPENTNVLPGFFIKSISTEKSDFKISLISVC